MKPHIPVTLICVDTTKKVYLAERAIRKCMEVATFDAVKLLTNDISREHAIEIPTLDGLEAYSNFVIRQLHKYVNTPYCLLVQSDGYIINPEAWNPIFLQYDFIGAVWSKSNRVGNGGFSLRSKKFLQATSKFRLGENCHPEDAWSTLRHGAELTKLFNIKFPNSGIADLFSFEGRVYEGSEWNGIAKQWSGSFGFHSWLTVLPSEIDKPIVFHHSGDAGDVIYGLSVMKAMGGGVLFLSPDNRYPYPVTSRWCREGGGPEWVSNLAPLLESQDYVWCAKYTKKVPFSCSVDLNSFRKYYKDKTPYNFRNLLDLHQLACGTSWPESKPWMNIDSPLSVPGKPIAINRTTRYHNDEFPWRDLIMEYSQQMFFLGTVEEYQRFWWEYKCPQIPHVKTGNLLDVARYICGSKVFIGNQSSPLAISLAVGHNSIVETWIKNANCSIKRDNVIHCTKGQVSIPEEWIK